MQSLLTCYTKPYFLPAVEKLQASEASGLVGRLNSEGILTRPVFIAAEGAAARGGGSRGALGGGMMSGVSGIALERSGHAPLSSFSGGKGAGSSTTMRGGDLCTKGTLGLSGRSFTSSSMKQQGASRIAQVMSYSTGCDSHIA
jgi:hypothetical protein